MLLLYPKPNIPPHPHLIVAPQWMAQHDVSFHRPAKLTKCPILIEVLQTTTSLKVTSSSCRTVLKSTMIMQGLHLRSAATE